MFALTTTLPFDRALEPLRLLCHRAEIIVREMARDRFRLHVQRYQRRSGWYPSVIVFGYVSHHPQGSLIRVFVVPHWLSLVRLGGWIGLSYLMGGSAWPWIIGGLIETGVYVWEIFAAHHLFSETYSSNQAMKRIATG